MSLRYPLDTNIASYYLRRSSAALEERVNQGLLQQTLALSVLTRAELCCGQAGMAADDRRRGRPMAKRWATRACGSRMVRTRSGPAGRRAVNGERAGGAAGH